MFFLVFFTVVFFFSRDSHAETAVLSRLLGEKDELCIDRPLYEECLAICRLTYLDCLSSCDSSLCHSSCLSNFSACDNSCPCGTDCPTGCVECEEHPLCAGKCLDAEQNNPEYKSCLNDSLDDMTSCMKTCEPTDTCHETCCSGHRERMTSCPCFQSQGTSSTTAPPTTQQPLDPSEMFILVIRYSEAYVISGDGNSKVSATITAPADDYAKKAQHALIGNQLYIFGGDSEKRKIAALHECNFEEKSEKLLNDIDEASAALSIDGDSRVLLCFASGSNKNHCEIYDGTSSTSTTSSNYGHSYAKLGLYKNQPTTVGSHGSGDTRKVETLTEIGWSVIGDPPISNIRAHVLVGLESGNLLMLGGVRDGSTNLDDIWLLSNDSWSRTGTLKSAVRAHSSLQINDSIFLFAGFGSNNTVQRVDIDGDEIKNSEIIGNHSADEAIPVLFQVSSGFCA
ncbi:Oidioi.mRNA.OKI2018_I69.chr2.g5458.t1.cds [Oikopleura dioica]|uniref:Oidioi.mRNA.OKI2018_I69.chr2.g5458.t1.cds n=1 Tax=Oikopleura dioica TaxID=34765 RepID=A0ABN7T4P8_OIKDI|nr:Oidioi.mRNA.OKI2018_I69.chr2.g5458.t1.cds [Oikopleura dioica]